MPDTPPPSRAERAAEARALSRAKAEAEALRANLIRRKRQNRARTTLPPKNPPCR